MIEPGMAGRQRGITLVELMVVVAIVAVLATIAVYMFSRQSQQARASEVNATFAEIQARQEQHHLERSAYATTTSSTDATLTDYLPAGDPGKTARTLNVPAGPWTDLRFNPDRQTLYCGYVTVGGGGGTLPAEANIASGPPFSLCEPPCANLAIPDADDFFYMMAQCDFDGDNTNSTYFAVSFSDGMAVDQNGE